MDCDQARICLGVYVLGALDPAERSLVDAHIAACQGCRDELAELAGLPALLARVGAQEALALAEDSAPAPDAAIPGAAAPAATAPAATGTAAARSGSGGPPPQDLPAAALDLAAARRRRRKRVIAGMAAAAAVIIAAASFAGAHLAAGLGASQASAAQGIDYGHPVTGWRTASGETGGMRATVRYRGMTWGTQLAAKVAGVPVGTPCQLIVIGPAGTRAVAGSWVTDTAEGTVYYPGSSAVRPAAIREFEITVAGHRAIVIGS
jgi:anti-sigma factor RsiW